MAVNDDSFAHLRGQAGSRVQRPETLPDLTSGEIRGLYHELQIHQIELELQNEQVRESQFRLEQSVRKYRELFTSMPVAFATIDPRGRAVDCNPAGCDVLGIKPGVSFTFTKFIAPQDADRFALLCRDVLATKRPRQCEMLLVRSDQSYSRVKIDCFPLTSFDEQQLGIAFQDITAQVEAERALRAHQAELQLLTRRLFAAQEEEGQKIARDLDDDYARRINGMIGETELLGTHLRSGHEAHDVIARLRKGLDLLSIDLRFMARRLRPLDLPLESLTHSMKQYIEDFSRHSNVKSRCRIGRALDELPHECGIHLYRLLQEALSNVARHADASHVNVTASKKGRAIELTITDDGQGFDLKSALRERKGMGLIAMQERVRQLSGRIAIESSASKGTSIQVAFSTDACASASHQRAA